ncbi:MAG: two-component regulator propeller domain-containing protein [Bacteroidota bacterium]
MRLGLFIISILCLPMSLIGQQFNFQNLSVGEGLAQSQVYAMLTDSRGYLWMGTQGGGLSRFDGKSFRNYSTRDSLSNNYIEALYEDQEGHIWVGTQDGLSRFDGMRFANFENPHKEANQVRAIVQDKTGEFWLGTQRGIYRFDGNRFTLFGAEEKVPLTRYHDVFIDSKGSIWFGGDRGIVKVDNDHVQIFSTKDGLSSREVQSIAETADGIIWFGTYGGGLNYWDGSRFESVRQSDGLGGDLVLTIHPDSTGHIWVGTQNAGVTIYSPADTTFRYLRERDGLCNNHVRSILEDVWGNTWIGTSGGGVSKYSGQQFIHFDTESGLNGDYVYAICQDSSDRIWLSASAKGVSVYDGSDFTHYGKDSSFLDIKSKAIFEDRQGRIWVGSDGAGIALFDRDTFYFLNVQGGLAGNWVRDIKQDRFGQVWIADAGGGISAVSTTQDTLGHWNFKVRRYGLREGMPGGYVNDLHFDRQGRLWFATRRNGIGYIDKDEIAQFSLSDGLPSNAVRSIVEDAVGYLWFGTADAGLAKAQIYGDSIIFETSGLNVDLASENIYLLLIDDEQNLWAGSEIGVDQIFLNEERNVKKVRHYGKSEGFVGIETCQNAAIKDGDGNLWFGTINGLTRFNPGYTLRNPIAPALQITDVHLFYKSLTQTAYSSFRESWGNLEAGLELPYKDNHIGFEFLGINHSNPEKVLYQWRLEGAEDSWSPRSSRTDVMYANLRAGTYRFRLRAFNEDMVMSEIETSSFTVLPPFWATWWFRICAISTIILFTIWFFMARINKVKRKAREAQEKLEMENTMLQLEQKALQLQMNPHFIFNALNSIQSLIIQNDHKKARSNLTSFAKLMRAILENSRTNTISLDKEINVLENYLSLEQFSRGHSFDYEIKTSLEADPDELEIPPMMIQPFVENAIIHGVGHLEKGKKGTIQVTFNQNDGMLECTIQDNGVGLTRSNEINKNRTRKHKSAALEVTRERLAYMNENQSSDESLVIEEIKSDDGIIEGTRVILRMPVA